jgi:DNA topoisomerase-6 subunit B
VGAAATKRKSKKKKGQAGTRRQAKTVKPRGKTKTKPGVETLPLFDQPEKAPEKPAVTASEPGKTKTAARGKRTHQTAQAIGLKQREISISEFFAKNRHLLGFDSLPKALLTAIKEAVDNSLDACEEAGLMPDILVEIGEVAENRYRVVVEDSGPGIVKSQVPRIFGKLLYGSKFHVLKQSRGQQGIGISAAVMYAQLTTGKPVKVTSRTSSRQQAHAYELQIDTKKNNPVMVSDRTTDWERPHGIRIEMELAAAYKKGQRSSTNV